MSNLIELYRDLILDHNKNPRNFGELENATKSIEGVNPLCGDKLKLFLLLENDLIKDISFIGTGCAISVASASMMTENAKGLEVNQCLELYSMVHSMLTGKDEIDEERLGKIMALSGVKAYPSRVKCASLSWHALKQALSTNQLKASTE
jgi:nitrogen fixation NifU-like protein